MVRSRTETLFKIFEVVNDEIVKEHSFDYEKAALNCIIDDDYIMISFDDGIRMYNHELELQKFYETGTPISSFGFTKDNTNLLFTYKGNYCTIPWTPAD